jgi:universal stress protein A
MAYPLHRISNVTLFQRILCPVDFSDASQVAVEEALSLARLKGGAVKLLHVCEIPVPSSPLEVVAPGVIERGREELRRELALWRERAAAATQGVTVTAELRLGSPAAEILRAAGEGCDLIVMGTHGRTGLMHLLLGSVAEKVLRKAPCSVLTVRAPSDHSVHP